MIRSFYGLDQNPFFCDGDEKLLPQQQEVYDTLHVHTQQGGLCLVLGVPGTGKTQIKEVIRKKSDDKRALVVSVSRTLHTYTNTIRILCQAFGVEFGGTPFKCERRLIEAAYKLNSDARMLVIIFDDAHLLDMQTFRKLRLLFEDFPKNHNVILIGQPELMTRIGLSVNEDIKSRVTYSVVMKRLNPDDIRDFIYAQLDHVGLGHNTFTEEALELIVRSADGVIRRAKNLCVSCLYEGVRARTRTIGLEIVNRVLIQPHWREDDDLALY